MIQLWSIWKKIRTPDKANVKKRKKKISIKAGKNILSADLQIKEIRPDPNTTASSIKKNSDKRENKYQIRKRRRQKSSKN